jgi:hypothetical protein
MAIFLIDTSGIARISGASPHQTIILKIQFQTISLVSHPWSPCKPYFIATADNFIPKSEKAVSYGDRCLFTNLVSYEIKFGDD